MANYPLGLTNAREFIGSSRALSRGAHFTYEGASLEAVREGGGGARLSRALVSGDFFAVLGARPVMGRALTAEDDAHGAAPVVVLSHRAWRERFGGSADVIGQRIVLHEDGLAYTVVGVMPQGLDYPRGTDVWATILAAVPEANVQYVAVNVIGRLATGVTPVQAETEMTAFLNRPGTPSARRDLRGSVRLLPTLVLGETRPAVLVFAAASGLLLLITCVNVANLLLVRGLARAREMAVRIALGASRGRVIGQLLTEHGVLALAGGALGLLLAWGAVRSFVAFAPAGLPRLDEIQLDATAVLGAIVITGLAMLIFGLAPAITTSRVELQQVLSSGARQSASRGSRLATEALVAGQVALALLVLSAAALIGRSLMKLESADLSFESSRLLVGELALRYDRYDTPPRQQALLDRLLPEVAAIPGVVAVSPVVSAPFATAAWDGSPAREGQSAEEATSNPLLNMEVVTPNYFSTIGVPMVRGRRFTDEDRRGAPSVVILSETAARHYWPDGDPIGKRLVMRPGGTEPMLTVIGVVPDTRYRDLRTARPSIYFPLAQSFFPFTPTALVIRTTGAPDAMIPALRRVLQQTAPDVALASAKPFDDFLTVPLAQPRLNALLLAVFAAAAVLLAGVGLFAVMATMVRQRTREFGVRMALGATSGDVWRMVLRRGMLLAAGGTAMGLLGAVAANRLLAAMLYEVSPTDAPTLLLVALALLGVAALASLIPARSSTRIEPMLALRAE
jgi:predicted permease